MTSLLNPLETVRRRTKLSSMEPSKLLLANNKKSQATILKRIDVSQPSPNYISSKYPGMTKMFRVSDGPWDQSAVSARIDKENNAKLMSGTSSPHLMMGQKKLAGGFMIRRSSRAQIVGGEAARNKSNNSIVESMKEDLMQRRAIS